MAKKITYRIPFFSNITGRGIQEKKGYLYRFRAGNESYYFFISHGIDRYGNQLKTWDCDEFYTGLRLLTLFPTRYDAIATLKSSIRQGILRQVSEVLRTAKLMHEILNVNPESFSYDITDLTV